MKRIEIKNIGILSAFASAFLFGASTPFAKLLLTGIHPWLLASLLYLGSGLGLTLYRKIIQAPMITLNKREIFWFAGAILSGGVIAPVLLMLGLVRMPASSASLLLNAESVFTAVLAWLVFKENVDRRLLIGMLAIVMGAIFLSWSKEAFFSSISSFLLVLAACFAWGVDNNLTRKVSLNDATWIASVKGLVAGLVNFLLAITFYQVTFPPMGQVVGTMMIGFFAYGLSLTLFVVGLRHLGTARTGAYFSIAPFVGAVIAVLMGEAITVPLLIAGVLMGFGVWLHLTEKHEHIHRHEALEHEHEHIHDEHHQHSHDYPVAAGVKHCHRHQHQLLEHSHPHYPDIHHQHKH